MLPPNDPERSYRSELPALPKDRKPVGYRAGWQFEERLQGVGVILLGLVGLLVVYGIYIGFLPAGIPAPPQPKGLLVPIPTINAISCVLPLIAIGSVACVIVGIRRVLDP